MTKATKSNGDRLKEWEKARFSPSPEPELNPIEPALIEMVSMRDGIKLYTEIFLPRPRKASAELRNETEVR